MNRMVLCNVDGMITAQENFVAMLTHFTPEHTRLMLPQLYHKEMPLGMGD